MTCALSFIALALHTGGLRCRRTMCSCLRGGADGCMGTSKTLPSSWPRTRRRGQTRIPHMHTFTDCTTHHGRARHRHALTHIHALIDCTLHHTTGGLRCRRTTCSYLRGGADGCMGTSRTLPSSWPRTRRRGQRSPLRESAQIRRRRTPWTRR